MKQVVDLTQPLGPDVQPWPGSPPLSATVEAKHERDGLYARHLSLPEHLGTHVDAPAHFNPEGASLAELPAERLVAAAAVLHVQTEDPGLVVTAAHLEAHEAEHGRLDPGMLILAATGWDRYVADRERYLGDPLAFPGYAEDAAVFASERGAVGLGIDTLGVDPGSSTTYPVHHHTSSRGLFHIEGLVNLGALPPRGATVFIGVPPLVAGSGMTARVLALV